MTSNPNNDPAAPPSATDVTRWAGRGRYDGNRDELVIESLGDSPKPAAGEPWVAGHQQLRAMGLTSGSSGRVELIAKGDFGALGARLATKSQSWSGPYDALVQARRDEGVWKIGAKLGLPSPATSAAPAEDGGRENRIALTMNGDYTERNDRIDIHEMTLTAPDFQVEGSGLVRDVTTRAAIDLKGVLDFNWKAINAWLARSVEPGARIAGRPREWRLAGTLDGWPAFDRMGSLEGEMGVQIDALDVFGMRLSEAPVVLRAAGGRVSIDPIDSTLNGGDLHLEPELVRGKDRSTWLHLGADSRLDGAVVNDEVSHRVLSFAAPVLDGATRVEGEVSVALADAYFPLIAPEKAELQIKGDVLFRDVRFMPGPLVDQLIGVFRRERQPLAVLRDPISVNIAGRKVYQRGLTIPVGTVASIGMDGSVDFDQNLDLVARFSLTPPDSNIPVLSSLMSNARFELPIRGTLKNPKIDGDALKEYWKGVGANLLGGSMEAGVDELQKLLRDLPAKGLRDLLSPRRRRGADAPPDPQAPADQANSGRRPLLGPIMKCSSRQSPVTSRRNGQQPKNARAGQSRPKTGAASKTR